MSYKCLDQLGRTGGMFALFALGVFLSSDMDLRFLSVLVLLKSGRMTSKVLFVSFLDFSEGKKFNDVSEDTSRWTSDSFFPKMGKDNSRKMGIICNKRGLQAGVFTKDFLYSKFKQIFIKRHLVEFKLYKKR
jgi:hypothetical protein